MFHNELFDFNIIYLLKFILLNKKINYLKHFKSHDFHLHYYY